jgi:hypothetical protein
VIEDPTPVTSEGVEMAIVYHFSSLKTLNARNTLIAMGKIQLG